MLSLSNIMSSPPEIASRVSYSYLDGPKRSKSAFLIVRILIYLLERQIFKFEVSFLLLLQYFFIFLEGATMFVFVCAGRRGLGVYQFARATVIRYHELDDLNNGDLFSSQCWRLEVKDQGVFWQGWFLLTAVRKKICSRPLSLTCRWLFSCVFSSPFVHVQMFLSYMDTSHIRLGPTLMTLFQLHPSFKKPCYQMHPHSEVLELELQQMNFGWRGTVSPEQRVWLLNRICRQFSQVNLSEGKHFLDVASVIFCCITRHLRIQWLKK